MERPRSVRTRVRRTEARVRNGSTGELPSPASALPGRQELTLTRVSSQDIAPVLVGAPGGEEGGDQ